MTTFWDPAAPPSIDEEDSSKLHALGVLGDEPPAQLDRGQRRMLQLALQREDLRRRLTEAKALIREHGGIAAEQE